MESIPAFYFDPQQLNALLEQHRFEFQTAKPFPHISLESLVSDEILQLVLDEFPPIERENWCVVGPADIDHTKNKQIEKACLSDENQFGPFTRHFFGQLQSASFVKFLEELTGLKGLVVDPSHNGCGLHTTGRGGRLMMHIDTNRHPIRQLHQRLNLIVFLNRDWKEEYGGHLELWDYQTKACQRKILPSFNRWALFDTGTRSLHGHPHPLTCPPGRRRNSLAVYYYVPDRQKMDDYGGFQERVTWHATSEEERERLRTFEERQRLKAAVKRFIPPVGLEVYRYLKSTRIFPD